MVTKNVDMLQDLVQIARDSKSFYESAINEVKNPIVQKVFERMAQAKRDLIAALSDTIIASGETPQIGGTVAGSLRQAYADLLAAFSRNDEAVYASQLEETEDRLLRHFDEALSKTDSMAVRAALKEQMPKVRTCHDEMKRLKSSLAA
jgi:uncharacterized protein (TIGR02284 family)